MRVVYFIILFFFFAVNAISQSDFGIEMWRDHLPYANVIQVAKLGDRCYAATPYSLYYVDETENYAERLTTIEGLSDFAVSSIAANELTKTIVVGYENGNIDLIKNDVITNLNAITISNIIGNRTIYNIHCDKQYAYLACGFGIVVLDLAKNEVKDTYLIGDQGSQIKINDITITSSALLAASDSGIYIAPINSAFLSDFNSWSRVTSFNNYQTSFGVIHSQNDQIYVVNSNENFSDDTLKVFDENFNELYRMDNDDFNAVETKNNDQVIISKNYNVDVRDQSFQNIETLYTYGGNSSLDVNQTIWDGNAYWIADQRTGLNRSVANFDYAGYQLQGPLVNDCFSLSAQGNQLYVATGKVAGSAWNIGYNRNGVLAFDYDRWYVHDHYSEELIVNDSVSDFIHVGIDPSDANHALFSSFNGGLFEYQDGEIIKRYTDVNSELALSLVHNHQIKVSCSSFDNNGNIWACCSFVDSPLVLITPDGDSKKFNIGVSVSNSVITAMHIEKSSQNIWIAVRGKGIVVYNFNETPEDQSDDEYLLLTAAEGSGNLASDIVNCITEDRDGEIWVGTEKGPSIFFSPSLIFEGSSNYDAQQVLLLQDGSYQYLLETQNVTGIVIDGANRKWFSTSAGGVFLMSEDGTEQLYNFNTSNSPIFSNVILSIAMNEESGELFIGTDKGIIGFRGTATEPKVNMDDVYCFPNPVRPGYNGAIGIKGVTENADIRVTDAAGNLVFSTKSYGGQAVWYGKNQYGEDVVSGVYFVFVTSEDGLLKGSTKVQIIR